MNKTTNITLKLAAAAMLLLTGCRAAQSKMATEKANDQFAPVDENRSTRRTAIAQEAAGARHDGMLYTYHFDGEHLNSLGRHKLSLMMRNNDAAFPIVVYMNLADDAHMKTRQEAVATYLADAGLHQDQLRLEVGPNPNATSSAAQNLGRYGKTEDVAITGSNPTSPQAPGYGTGGGTGDSGVPKP
jgi:hypothetical protein